MLNSPVEYTEINKKSKIKPLSSNPDVHVAAKIGHMPLPFANTRFQNLLYTVVYHDNCFHNMILGVRNRVIAKTPTPDPTSIKTLTQLCRRIAKRFTPTHQQEFDQFYLPYPLQKRRRYARGHEDLTSMPPSMSHASLAVFVKPDKVDPISKPYAIPRLIQFRRPTFAVELASYLKPIEEQVYQFKFNHKLMMTHTRLIAKGLNQVERARVALVKWQSFIDPVALVLDMSRFDMHVNVELLKVEHLFYTLICNDARFKEILTLQLKNLCKGKVKYSEEALRYVVSGCRMSGDMNTALGNCILMLLMTISYCLHLQIFFDLLDDGDDMILFTEKRNLTLVQSTATEYYLKFGMKLKVEGSFTQFPEINFCQSCPIHTSMGWKFVRNPIKILSTSLSGARFANTSSKYLKKITAGQGLCEAILNSGVPVLANYAAALLRNAGLTNISDAIFDEKTGTYLSYLREKKMYDKLDLQHCLSQEITVEARDSFEIAFGISVSDQYEMEASLDAWTIDFENHIELPDRFDAVTWKFKDDTEGER